MALGIENFNRLERFSKAYRRLDKRHQKAVDDALAELLNDNRPRPSRNLEKVRSRKNTWAIRVSKGIRLSFEVADGTCILRNVGEHDKTLDAS